jgi:hypothetical protein
MKDVPTHIQRTSAGSAFRLDKLPNAKAEECHDHTNHESRTSYFPALTADRLGGLNLRGHDGW